MVLTGSINRSDGRGRYYGQGRYYAGSVSMVAWRPRKDSRVLGVRGERTAWESS